MIVTVEHAGPKNNFAGLRVLTLESRRAQEMASLIVSFGGEPMVAPSMREVPLESNLEAQKFARSVVAGGFDSVIFLTGVGTRAIARVVESIYPIEQFVSALKGISVIARGSKPAAVLKELGVPVALVAPEPNTWREVLQVLDQNAHQYPLKSQRVAVQEYGVSNPDLLAGLSERGAQVTSVQVYEWALPEDLGPLRAAALAIAHGKIDVCLFTSAMQVNHLLQVAEDLKIKNDVLAAFSRIAIASIGPVTSERLLEYGIAADMEPSRPKMGYLVSETAARSAQILQQKRSVSK
jgi:uroporphyrinogen-III synthase